MPHLSAFPAGWRNTSKRSDSMSCQFKLHDRSSFLNRKVAKHSLEQKYYYSKLMRLCVWAAFWKEQFKSARRVLETPTSSHLLDSLDSLWVFLQLNGTAYRCKKCASFSLPVSVHNMQHVCEFGATYL